ncbi:MAG TPA: hypothetical protein VJA19_07850 [Pseudomonas sp.]|nr:hypothetical protein [Pseudomonas sp.]
MIMLKFESTLPISRELAWQWITDADALRAEMRPLLKMTVPKGRHNLAGISPGQPLFTSWLWLFGLLPLGASRLTLTQVRPGEGFIEESPMTALRYWRHERRIDTDPEHPRQVRLVDELRVEPYFAPRLLRLFLTAFFNNRHRVLRKRCIGLPPALPEPAAKPAQKTRKPRMPKPAKAKPAAAAASKAKTPRARKRPPTDQ